MSGAWGTGSWGLGPFGGPIAPSLALAVASSTNSVDVTFSAQPLAMSFANPNDALNPSSWVITRLDNGFSFTIVSVEQLSPVMFRIFTVEAFGPYTVLQNVDASQVHAPDGASLTPPTNLNFFGVLAETMLTPNAVAAARNLVTTDVQNLPIPTVDSQLAGTLVMTAGGDYATVSGDAFVKKLIIRRLVTPTGGFFHLPDYGVGLQVANVIPGNDLTKLKTAIENQCLKEPEVSAAQASLSFDLSNQILYVQVLVQTQNTGNTLQVGFTMNASGVVTGVVNG
ncbi:MAG TPA: hypothetical protein VLV86_13415 [Vicinamibacterales bacterium]|nr:hypothetical protein [Vicinamibacterales bacterium]